MTTTGNTWKRKALAIAAVALLSVPSAIGVQRALAPTRGEVASWLAAAGFEAVYISTAVLLLSSSLRRYAQRVALAAVAVAVVLNAIADYAQRVEGGLRSAEAFVTRFDWLALALSVIESVPLAALSYAMATLLHRLSEEESKSPEEPVEAPTVAPSPALSFAREGEPPALYAAPVAVAEDGPVAVLEAINSPQAGLYLCPSCGATLESAGALGAAKRWGHCPNCKPQVE